MDQSTKQVIKYSVDQSTKDIFGTAQMKLKAAIWQTYKSYATYTGNN